MEQYKLFILDNDKKANKTFQSKQNGFSFLPFAAVLKGQEEPLPSTVKSVIDDYPIEWVTLLKGIDTLLSMDIDVLSISWKPNIEKYSMNDPFIYATKYVNDMNIPVIVAAGNYGPNPGTLQVLAEAPWNISAGATDKDGKLLDSSSRGYVDGPKPTVVCFGTSDLECADKENEWKTFSPCTSFAAPKIAAVAALVKRFIQLIKGDFYDYINGNWTCMGTPLKRPVLGIPDTGIDLKYIKHSTYEALWHGQDYIRFGRSDEELKWYKSVIDALKALNLSCQICPSPEKVKNALKIMARKMPEYKTYEVGAGFVYYNELDDFFSNFTFSSFIRLFEPDLTLNIRVQDLERYDKIIGKLWPEEKVENISNVLSAGIQFAVVKVF